MRVTRVLAPNPGLYTGPGTNTYLVESEREVVVIDPGPEEPGHLAAIRGALGSARAVAVVVTHTHPDHAPLANTLAGLLGVPSCGYGPGPDFEPERELGDGEEVEVGRHRLQAIHTPGHSPDHLCFLVADLLFTGDHIMGGSTVVVEDMTAYLDSLRRLQGLRLRRIHPGHGPDIEEPQRVIAEYLEHRLQRESQVLRALVEGAETLSEVVERVYRDLDPRLHALAAQSALAHLRKLAGEGRIELREAGSDNLWAARDGERTNET